MTRETRAGLAAVMLGSALVLSGCQAGAAQTAWVSEMERVDGVRAVDHEHIDHALVQPAEDIVTLDLAPDLTTSQALGIAEASCTADVHFTRVTLRTSRAGTGGGSVVFEDATEYGDGCIPAGALRTFAAAAAAMTEPTWPSGGDLRLSRSTESELKHSGAIDSADTVDIVTTGVDAAHLLDTVRAVHRHLGSSPLRYFGWLDDDRDPRTSATSGISVRLTDNARFRELDPLITAAVDLGAVRVDASDRALEVVFPAGSSPDTQLLQEQATQAGVALTVSAAA